MATGIFDILHSGHIHFLEEARKLGDELVVVVACDATAKKQKHEPIMNEKMRHELIAALRIVDKAVIGHEGDMYAVVEELRPDIIAIGYDQFHNPDAIQTELDRRCIKSKVVRLEHYVSELDGTRKVIRKIVDWWGFQQKIGSVETPLKPKMTKEEYLRKEGGCK